MNLMEYCEVRLAPVYEGTLVPIRCAWCEGRGESVLFFGDMWVCPTCFGEAERKWNERKG